MTGPFYFEPTDLEAHVKLFDKTFKSHPLTREQMREKLDTLNIQQTDPGPEGVSESLVAFVMDLQKRALFGLRLALLVEETGEWCEAVLKDKPIEEQENEVADIEYVLHGLNDTMGYNSNAARGRVATKNHTKIQNADKMKVGVHGKIIKESDQIS